MQTNNYLRMIINSNQEVVMVFFTQHKEIYRKFILIEDTKNYVEIFYVF